MVGKPVAMNEWRRRTAPTPPTHLGRLLDGLVGSGHLLYMFLLRQCYRRDVIGGLAHGALLGLDRRLGRDLAIDLHRRWGRGGVALVCGDGGVRSNRDWFMVVVTVVSRRRPHARWVSRWR